jgi:hypothetical protein
MRDQPCERDCPDRAAGCGATCERWQAYVKRRDEGYRERLDRSNEQNMIFENKVKFIRHAFVHRRK